MTALLAFAVTLLIAVLISELANRSVLSTSVIFLFAGVLMGPSGFGAITPRGENPYLGPFASLALFSVLFTDGMKVGLRDVITAWQLPGRALLMGLPLTLLGTALLGRLIVGLPWPQAFLLGAVLSPTDPVFAAAIVGREGVPKRLRRLLNVESGLNDGLALPLVVGLLAYAAHQDDFKPWYLLSEVGMGVVIGVAIPWVAIKLEQTRFFSAETSYEPLFGFSIGLLVLALSKLMHANEYLAAFSAGITVATLSPRVRKSFHSFGGLIAELLKLAAVMIFGSAISLPYLAEIPFSGYVFAVLAILAVRPVALWISLLGSELGFREKFAAAWFGPKGFASVVFGLIVLESGLDRADQLGHLIALVVAGSIIAHSSTDVPVAAWLHEGMSEEERNANALHDEGDDENEFTPDHV